MNSERAAQEITFIKQVIEENRKVSYPNGIYYIIWGIMVFLGMLGNYFLVKAGRGKELIWMWLIIAVIGWIFTLVESRKEDRKAGYVSWSGKLYGYIWLSAGICMTVIGFSGPFIKIIHPMAICPLIGLFMGFAHFISGLMNAFKWQQIVGIFWWIGSILLLFWVVLENFLLFGVLMILLHALPGFVLNNYYKKN